MRPAFHHRAGAEPRIRPHETVRADLGMVHMREGMHNRTAFHAAVPDHAMRFDDHVRGDVRMAVQFAGAEQFRARLHGYIRAHTDHVRAVHGHAGSQPFLHDGTPPQFLGCRQFGGIVDPEQVRVAAAGQPAHDHAFGHGHAHKVGDVIFAALVLVAELRDKDFHGVKVQHVDPRVDLAGRLPVDGDVEILRFHDGTQFAVLTDDAAIRAGVFQRQRRHGHVRAFSIKHEIAQRIRRDQRGVPVDHKHFLHARPLQFRQGDHQGVPGAELFLLLHETQIAARKRRPHHIRLVPDDGPYRLAEQGAQRSRHMPKQRFAQNSVQHLGLLGVHTGTLARRENQGAAGRGKRAGIGHHIPSCVSFARGGPRAVSSNVPALGAEAVHAAALPYTTLQLTCFTSSHSLR